MALRSMDEIITRVTSGATTSMAARGLPRFDPSAVIRGVPMMRARNQGEFWQPEVQRQRQRQQQQQQQQQHQQQHHQQQHHQQQGANADAGGAGADAAAATAFAGLGVGVGVGAAMAAAAMRVDSRGGANPRAGNNNNNNNAPHTTDNYVARPHIDSNFVDHADAYLKWLELEPSTA